MEDNKQARRWFLTINNPEKTDDDYIEYIQGLEHFKYCAFQREKGEKTGTEHIQGFIVFSIGKRFATIKNYFPTAHIEAVKGSNVQARDYCTKSETRVSGPYELGTFAEERSRTDISMFVELVQNGASTNELAKLYPNLYMRELNKIEAVRQNVLYEKYRKELRYVKVTYIYGPPGSGKSSYIMNKCGLGNYYELSYYGSSSFDNYKNEKIIVLDEFDSSLKITFLNKLLDRYPLMLPARYSNKVACYDEVYIVSNLKLSEQYKDIQESKPDLYKAFMRRIHNIIRIDEYGIHNEKLGGLKQIQLDLKDIW